MAATSEQESFADRYSAVASFSINEGTPFGGSDGADTVSNLLCQVHSLLVCLEASFDDADTIMRRRDLEIDSATESLSEHHKARAMQGIASLVALAKLCVDEDHGAARAAFKRQIGEAA